MADKRYYIPETLEFHPCDTPRGMEYYNLEILTRDQQKRLNSHKTETIRDNQKYLFKNPEIRGVLQVILRKLLLERPTHDIERFIGQYFAENWEYITKEVARYVASLPGKPQPALTKLSIRDDKHVTLEESKTEVSTLLLSVSSEENLTRVIVKEILEEILDNIHDVHIQKRVRTSETVDVIAESKHSKESLDEDDELYFDLGLDFDLDFSTYHEDEL